MSKPLPPTYTVLAFAIMLALHRFVPGYRYLSSPWTLVGIVPLFLGVLLNVMADRQFKRHDTTVKPFQRSSALVTTFPFSVSRNPMYLGLALIVFGVALLLGTLGALVPAVILPYLLDRHFIRVEEQMLAATFGPQWKEYRSRVRRWI